MIANRDKIKLSIMANRESCTLQINYRTIILTSSVTLLGITIEIKLNFENHINTSMQKTYNKIYALRRLRKF